MTRARVRLATAVAVLAVLHSGSALADGPTPPEIAQIQHDQQAAEDKVNAEHGNRAPSEMSPEERRQVIQETAAADQKVLDDHKVDLKDYARTTAKLSLDQRQQVEDARKALDEKDRAAKQEAEKKAAAERAKAAAGPVVTGPGDEDDADDVDDTPAGEVQIGADTGPLADDGSSAAPPAADDADAPAPKHKGGGKSAKKKGKHRQ